MPKIVSKTAKKKVKLIEATDSERRTALTRGVLSYRDILDQPQGKYFLIVETSPMGSLLFAVDDVKVSEDEIIASSGETIVTRFAPNIPWYTVSKEYVDSITTEEMAKRTNEDNELMHDLREALSKKRKNGKKDDSPGYL